MAVGRLSSRSALQGRPFVGRVPRLAACCAAGVSVGCLCRMGNFSVLTRAGFGSLVCVCVRVRDWFFSFCCCFWIHCVSYAVIRALESLSF